jgi:hypothetical protein
MPFIVPHRLPPSTSSLLGVLQHVIPPAVLDAVVAHSTAPGSRRRKLPGDVLLPLLVAWHLLPPAALDLVLTTLLQGLRIQDPDAAVVPAGESGISRARYRWGVTPIRDLFRQVCRPLATPATRGAFFHGLRLMAIDATFEDVADTPANVRVFGRHRNQHGESAFPQLLGMYLLECGTHAIIDAGFWPCHTSQVRAATRLLRSITPDMLVLYDQGLHGFPLIQRILDSGAQILGRVPPIQTFTRVECLPDGTTLCRFWAKPPCDRTSTTASVLVRVITYTLDDPARPGHRQRHRLMTSLLDPETYPALDLICTYHERWEIELAIDEIKTHQRLCSHPLRSQKPRGIIQEAYGLLLAHYAVRAVMHDAALQGDIDPDRLSFTHSIRLIDRMVPHFYGVDQEHHDALYRLLLRDILRFQLPPRRSRIAPRARKRPWSKHRLRRRGHCYHVVRVAPFREVVAMLPPDPTSLLAPPAT